MFLSLLSIIEHCNPTRSPQTRTDPEALARQSQREREELRRRFDNARRAHAATAEKTQALAGEIQRGLEDVVEITGWFHVCVFVAGSLVACASRCRSCTA
jgi:regulator of replication initiation timing